MFKCSKCKTLESEIKFLREMNEKLTNQLIAVSNPNAYAALHCGEVFDEKDYYGNEHDELIEFDQFGQRILVKQNQ